jgi:hypothetical protein
MFAWASAYEAGSGAWRRFHPSTGAMIPRCCSRRMASTSLSTGSVMVNIPDPHFAELKLATFVGPLPPTPRLKRELLGFRD